MLAFMPSLQGMDESGKRACHPNHWEWNINYILGFITPSVLLYLIAMQVVLYLPHQVDEHIKYP
jgi:hypothetical protein